ncbi:MAG: TetR family transcriptional regulator [Sphingobium sp.]
MKIASRNGSRRRSAPDGAEPGRSDTYDFLLTVTAKLLTEKDSVDFSLSEIALRSGMSAALVQYHFGSKDGLLMALLERGTAKAADQLVALEKMPVSVSERLRIHVKGLVSAYMHAPYINRLLHHIMSSGDEARAIRTSELFITPIANFYARLIDQGVEEGVFRPIAPMHLYFMLVGACDQLVARRSALQHAFGVRELTEEMGQNFCDTLYHIISTGLAAEK